METLVFYVIVLSIYIIGEKMGNPDGAVQCISGVVYAIIYFYAVNILRNAYKLLPKSKGLKFIYYVLSFEILKKIPYLQQYTEHEKEVEESIKKED
jgi:multisubunit Na+/H+ antiporter MnhB subunit